MPSELHIDCRDLAKVLADALAEHVGGTRVAVEDGKLALILEDVKPPHNGVIPIPKLSEVRLVLASLPSPRPHELVVGWEWSARHVPAWLMNHAKDIVTGLVKDRIAQVPAVAQAIVSLDAQTLVLDLREIRIGTTRLGDFVDLAEVQIPGRERAAVSIRGSQRDT